MFGDKLLYSSRSASYEKKYEALYNFFGQSLYDLDVLALNKDYILEALNSHNKNKLQKAIIKRYSNNYNLKFINLEKDKKFNKTSFQIFLEDVFNYSLSNDNKFISLLNFYGYYISQKFMITDKNRYLFNSYRLGVYYTISPTWSDNVNNIVYDKNKGVLYHFSPKRNKDSILLNGLRIKSVNNNIPQRLYCYSYLGNIKQKNNYNKNIIQFIKDIFSKHDLEKGISVFKINLPYNNIYIDFYTDDIMSDKNAVYTYTNIPSKYIKYIDNVTIND